MCKLCMYCDVAVLAVVDRCHSLLRRPSGDEQSDVWWRPCCICSVSDGTWIFSGGTFQTFSFCVSYVLFVCVFLHGVSHMFQTYFTFFTTDVNSVGEFTCTVSLAVLIYCVYCAFLNVFVCVFIRLALCNRFVLV